MSNLASGVNEEGLGNLSLEILDYADRISILFDKLDVSMEELKRCYRGPACDKVTQRYGEAQTLYPIIKDNIRSYSDDLIQVSQQLKEGDRQISKELQRISDDYRSKMKTINYKRHY